MADVLVRGVPEDVKRRLQERANRRGVSLATEMRDILAAAAAEGRSSLSRLRHAARAAQLTDDDVAGLDRVASETRGEVARDPFS